MADFIPVSDIMIQNNETFENSVAKTIISETVPENATNQEVVWSVGAINFEDFDYKHLYGLGPTFSEHTSASGTFKVNLNYPNEYWCLAGIVKNGLEAGTRNPEVNNASDTVIDFNGDEKDVTIKALIYDKKKDFVKIFCFNKYVPESMPRYVGVRIINRDDGYNPGMTRLVFYRLKSTENIGSTTAIKNGDSGYSIYNPGTTTVANYESATLSNVLHVECPKNSSNAKISIEEKPVSQLPVVQIDIQKYDTAAYGVHAAGHYLYMTESCVVEFNKPLNRDYNAISTRFFDPNPYGLNFRLDGTANWCMMWIGSNQYTTSDVYGSGNVCKPSATTRNLYRYWTHGGNPSGNARIWFILSPSLRGMKTGDYVTLYTRQWGFQY